MDQYVVVEYEQVDIRRFEDRRPRHAPGEVRSVEVVRATDETGAIEISADGCEGFFAAFPLPTDLKLVRAELVLHD